MGETVLVPDLRAYAERGKLDAAIENGVDWNVFLVDDISKSILPTRHDVGWLNRLTWMYKMDFESDAAFIERALQDGHSYERKDGTGPLATIFGKWLVT